MWALVRWIVSVACLLVLCSACTRQYCPGCTEPNPLPLAVGGTGVGCPYAASELGPAYGNGTITNPTMLILSGGASHGAWGAGVIAGWPEGTTAPLPRPEFTVVTGISTGALQAPYAFLGSSYDDELEKFYTTSSNCDIYTPNWTLSNSLQSREPLREILQTEVTEAAVLEVASQTNRELFVGTLNLDTSEFCPWNLSTIARKVQSAPAGSQTRECWVNLFRDAIFAASGAPVIAPPVEIDSNACKPGEPPMKMLHADGGVRARVFVADALRLAIEAGLNPTAYVIMNGKLVTHPECVEDSLMPIALRTFEIMDHEALFGSLYALMHKHPGQWKLRLSRIPDSCCLEFPSSEFDKDKMKILFEDGKQWVQTSPWGTTIPTSSEAPWPDKCRRPMGTCPGHPAYPPNTEGCL